MVDHYYFHWFVTEEEKNKHRSAWKTNSYIGMIDTKSKSIDGIVIHTFHSFLTTIRISIVDKRTTTIEIRIRWKNFNRCNSTKFGKKFFDLILLNTKGVLSLRTNNFISYLSIIRGEIFNNNTIHTSRTKKNPSKSTWFSSVFYLPKSFIVEMYARNKTGEKIFR